jgi:hypothetical protein
VRSSGTRHAVTELPAAEIRALLADRASLMDMEVRERGGAGGHERWGGGRWTTLGGWR